MVSMQTNDSRLKFVLWYDEVCRDIERVEHAKKIVAVGKLSGAVGTYSNIDPSY